MNLFVGIAIFTIAAGFCSLPSAQTKSTDPINRAVEAESTTTISVSPQTYHYHSQSTHQHVTVIGIEREYTDASLKGGAYFTNSFGQPSVYIYPWGRVYKSILDNEKLSFKWTGGVIYGYKDKFKDQVANVGGFAPAIIVSLAYQITPRWSVQMNAIGTAAAQVQINLSLK